MTVETVLYTRTDVAIWEGKNQPYILAMLCAADEFGRRELCSHWDDDWGGFRTTHELAGTFLSLQHAADVASKILKLRLGDPLAPE